MFKNQLITTSRSFTRSSSSSLNHTTITAPNHHHHHTHRSPTTILKPIFPNFSSLGFVEKIPINSPQFNNFPIFIQNPSSDFPSFDHTIPFLTTPTSAAISLPPSPPQ